MNRLGAIAVFSIALLLAGGSYLYAQRVGAFGALFAQQEDKAHVSGSIGAFILGVENEDQATLSTPDKAYTAIAVSPEGNLFIECVANCGGGGESEFADDAPFTLTSSKVTVAGAIRKDNPSILAAAELDVVPTRVDYRGAIHVNTGFGGPGTVDTFGRVVTSQPNNQVDVQFFRDDPENLVTVTTTNNGTATKVGGSAVFATTSDASGTAKGVSTVSTSYRSGAEIYMLLTARFTTPTAADSFQRIGLYDDNNGFFIGFEGTSFGVTVRNATSDTTVAKGSFSEDVLTGAVGSLFTRDGSPEAVDLTKFNVYRIRYGWLGSAPVVFEILAPDGRWVVFHIVRQPNNSTTASIENSDLPVTVHVSKTTSDGTNLIIATSCWAAGVTTDKRALSETLTDDTLTSVSRVVIVGKKPNSSYANVEITAGGNLKVAVEEIDDDNFIIADGGALGKGVLIQGDDGTDRKNVNVDASTGDMQVDVTNTVTVDLAGNNDVTTVKANAIAEMGVTELIGKDEIVSATKLSDEVSISLTGTGVIRKLCIFTDEEGASGTVYSPSGTLYLFDADPTVTLNDAALAADEHVTIHSMFTFSADDYVADALGAANCQATDEVFSNGALFAVWRLGSGETEVNTAAGDDEVTQFNIWYERHT